MVIPVCLVQVDVVDAKPPQRRVRRLHDVLAGQAAVVGTRVSRPEHHLGRSGLKVSEIAYGNWITHGSQVAEDAALACVSAALDEGITTFDTADVYAQTRAETVLGKALHGIR